MSELLKTQHIISLDTEKLDDFSMHGARTSAGAPVLNLITNTYYKDGVYSMRSKRWIVFEAAVKNVTCDSGARRFVYIINTPYKFQADAET